MPNYSTVRLRPLSVLPLHKVVMVCAHRRANPPVKVPMSRMPLCVLHLAWCLPGRGALAGCSSIMQTRPPPLCHAQPEQPRHPWPSCHLTPTSPMLKPGISSAISSARGRRRRHGSRRRYSRRRRTPLALRGLTATALATALAPPRRVAGHVTVLCHLHRPLHLHRPSPPPPWPTRFHTRGALFGANR